MHTLAGTKRERTRQKAQFSKSKVANLFRHRAGNYYAVAKVIGKVRRQSLDTSDSNLAKARLPAALAELRGTTSGCWTRGIPN